MAITWPSALVARSVSAHLHNMSASGGRTPTGRDQRVFNDAGYWRIQVGDLIVKDRLSHDTFEAIIARLGQGEEIDVPVPLLYPPTNVAAASSSVTVAVDAALRATTLELDSSGVELRRGLLFSIGERMHRITGVTTAPVSPPYQNQVANDAPWDDAQPWADAVTATERYVVSILPPLRAAVTADTVADFAAPKVRTILDEPNDGRLALPPSGVGTVSFSLIESI